MPPFRRTGCSCRFWHRRPRTVRSTYGSRGSGLGNLSISRRTSRTTRGIPRQKQRSAGFSNNPPEIWVNGSSSAKRRLQLVQPGGAPRDFLPPLAVNVAWSSNGKRLAYFTSGSVEGLPAAEGDSIYVADEDGGNAHKIFGSGKKGDHNHFLAWSADDRWIYFACGFQSVADLKLCRIPSSGETATPERLSDQANDVSYLTPIDERTVLYIAPDEDKSGPWLWALDVERRETHRVSTGLERYLSVAASANGRRLVATVVTQSTAGLWSVPILDRGAEARDVQGFPPTGRALAPRFGAGSLFYLSSSGPGDGLWRVQDQQAPVEIWNASKGPLLESPSVSPVGDRVAVVLRKEGKLQLALVSLDGADSPRSLAEGIDVRGTPAWSRNGESLVTGGRDAQGPGLFIITVRDGRYSRLADGPAFDPVWSPTEDLIVYPVSNRRSHPCWRCALTRVKWSFRPFRSPSVAAAARDFFPTARAWCICVVPSGSRTSISSTSPQADPSAHAPVKPCDHIRLRHHARRYAHRLRPCPRELRYPPDRSAEKIDASRSAIGPAGTSRRPSRDADP